MWDKGLGVYTKYIRRAEGGPVVQNAQPEPEMTEEEMYGTIAPPESPLMARAAEYFRRAERALEGHPGQFLIPGAGIAQVMERKAYGEDPTAFEYGMAGLDAVDIVPGGKIVTATGKVVGPALGILAGIGARGARNIQRRVDKLMERGLEGQELWEAQANQSKRGYYDPNDEQFRMEINTSGADLKLDNPNITDKVGEDPIYRVPIFTSEDIKLGDVLDFPEFFEVYPQFKGLQIKAVPFGSQNWPNRIEGMYDPFEKTLYMSQTSDKEKFMSTLLHELQHAVQAEERFAGGGNSLMFLPPGFTRDFEDASKARDSIKSGLEEFFKKSSGAEKLPFGIFDAFAALNAYGPRAKEALELIQEMKSTTDLSRRGELRDVFKSIPGYSLGDANNLERTLRLYGSPEEVMKARSEASFLIDNLQEVEKEYFDLVAQRSQAHKNYLRIPGEVESVNVENRRADPSLQSQYPPSTANFQVGEMVSPADPEWRRRYLKLGQHGPERPREFANGGGVGSLSHIARAM